MLHGEFLIQPVGTEVEPHILNNNQFFHTLRYEYEKQ